MPQPGSPAATAARSPTLAILALLAVAPLGAWLTGFDYLIPIGTQILIYALAASSLNLLVGYAGVFSLGHAAFIAVGAYAVAISAQYAGPGQAGYGAALWNQALITWPAAVLIAGVVSFLMALVCMKREGLTLAMITLAMGQMIYLLLVALKSFGGDDGLNMYPRNFIGPFRFEGDTSFYYLSFAVLVAYLLAIHLLMRSRLGRVVDAVAINPIRTAALGFSVYWTRVACFVFAAVGAALAGVLFANANEFVSPNLGNWSVTGELLVMIVVGGIATKAGPLLGAFFYIAILHVASDYFEQTGLILGAIVIAVVLLMPRGLIRLFERSQAA